MVWACRTPRQPRCLKPSFRTPWKVGDAVVGRVLHEDGGVVEAGLVLVEPEVVLGGRPEHGLVAQHQGGR